MQYTNAPVETVGRRWEPRIQGMIVRGRKRNNVSLSLTDLILDLPAWGEAESHSRRMEALHDPRGERRDTLESQALVIDSDTTHGDTITLSFPIMATRQNVGIPVVTPGNMSEYLTKIIEGTTSRRLDPSKPPEFILIYDPDNGIAQFEVNKKNAFVFQYAPSFVACFETSTDILIEHFNRLSDLMDSMLVVKNPDYVTGLTYRQRQEIAQTQEIAQRQEEAKGVLACGDIAFTGKVARM